ncbi:hypothetical protein L218DRAFT_512984 [Marasmius fiardii PR-910]|nr:hypothetical protein L218DRAFT_512984 [Marasmius fiardii PR-910]
MGLRRRHTLFYFDIFVYRVDDTVFALPSRYLKENAAASPILARTDRDREDSPDNTPVLLSPLPYHGNARDFESLARIIIALSADLSMPANYTLIQWLSVIKLSTSWGLNDIRAIGVQQLEEWNQLNTPLDQWLHLLEFFTNREEFSDVRSISISHISAENPHYTLEQWISALEFTFSRPELSDACRITKSHIFPLMLQSQLSSFEKIKLGRKYGERVWVGYGLLGLAEQTSPPSLVDLKSIGLQTALHLLHIRDITKSRPGRSTPSHFGYPITEIMPALIEEYFPDNLLLEDLGA